MVEILVLAPAAPCSAANTKIHTVKHNRIYIHLIMLAIGIKYFKGAWSMLNADVQTTETSYGSFTLERSVWSRSYDIICTR